MGAIKKHVIVGIAAGLLLVAIFTGIMTLAESFTVALSQAARIWYWIAAMAVGFGVQAGLFSFIRQSLKELAISTSVATSGGVSAGSMVACCAHHLTDVLPFLGLSGLAAFLSSYQTLFLAIGVLSNLVGITIMLETIQRHELCPIVAKWRWDMGRVKKITMASAGLIAGIIVFRTIIVS